MSERVDAVTQEATGQEDPTPALPNLERERSSGETGQEDPPTPVAQTEASPGGEAATGAETEDRAVETPVAQAEESPGADAASTADDADTAPEAHAGEDGPPAVAHDEPAEDSTPDFTEGSSSTPDPAPEPTSQSTAESTTESTAESTAESTGEKRVVRTLSVGQKVSGTVKRIADFGAFVDIGVGRDGLIHISELSVRRVGKVTDVLQDGQEIEAWIKKLDRERNRISLTLIDPDTKTIRDLEKGDVVQGRVTRLLPYGAFVDIGIGRDALLHVREMAEGFVAKPEDVVKADEEIEARIIDLSRRRNRVDLSLKGLRPEPEAAAPVQDDRQAPEAAEEEGVTEDAFEEVEVLSPMELAFKRAMEAEGMEVRSKKRGKRNRRLTGRDIQDEIISRTLQEGRS